MKTTFADNERTKVVMNALANNEKVSYLSTEMTPNFGSTLVLSESETAYPESSRVVGGYKRSEIMEHHKHGINLLEINGVK